MRRRRRGRRLPERKITNLCCRALIVVIVSALTVERKEERGRELERGREDGEVVIGIGTIVIIITIIISIVTSVEGLVIVNVARKKRRRRSPSRRRMSVPRLREPVRICIARPSDQGESRSLSRPTASRSVGGRISTISLPSMTTSKRVVPVARRSVRLPRPRRTPAPCPQNVRRTALIHATLADV